MKTRREIRDEIDALREIKSTVRRFTAFGDNWAAIDTQIDALTDEWTYKDAYDAEDNGDISAHERGSAIEAIAWANGNYEEYAEDDETVDCPSLSWKSLVV